MKRFVQTLAVVLGLLLAAGAITAATTNPQLMWFTATNGVRRLFSDKLADHLSVYDFGAKCDRATDDHVAMQRCLDNAWDCEFPGLLPGFTCSAKGNTLNLPTRHTISGPNMRAAVLEHIGTGCQLTVDNNDGWSIYHLTLASTGVTTGTNGVCVTNVNGPTLRGSVEDVMITSDAPSGTFAATGSISGTTLTVTVAGSSPIAVGAGVTGAGVTAGTFVSALGSGTGGAGTYTISPTQTVGSESLTFGVPPIPGTYGVYIHSTTGNSNYYADFRHLVTSGWERGVESLGDTGSGGANANFFSAYSGNDNTTGIYFDNFSGDNWAQGHCNGSGQNVVQNCVQLGDGTHNSAGNFLVGVTSDTGALGTAYKLLSPSGSNVVVGVNESSLLDQDTADSTNFRLVNKSVGPAARHFQAPDAIFGSTVSAATDLFIGQGLRPTAITVKTNTDYTIGQHDRTISVTGLTGPHTITLAANPGQMLTIGDADGSITGTNTLTIAPPATGKVNNSASGVVLASAGKSADCLPLTANGLSWSCRVSP